MVSVAPKRLRNDLLKLGFHFVDCLTGRQTRAVAHAEDVRVDGKCFLAERCIEHNVGRLSTDAGKRLELVSRPRDVAAVLGDELLAERDDVLRLRVEQADRLDGRPQVVLAEFDHLLRGFYVLEQGLGGDVHAGVRCLRRKHDRDQQLIRIAGFKLRGRRRIGLREPAEEFEDLVALHREPMTSRME